MPLVAKDGKLIIRKVFGGQPMLAGSKECCCKEECVIGCLKPTQWRIVEAEGDVYASGPVSDLGELDNFPGPWIAYWYTKTELSLKLEVEFPDEWKTLEEWESTISTCGDGPFATHEWGDVDPAPNPSQPPWPVPEPYNCQMVICPPTEPEEVRKWWISAQQKEAIDRAMANGQVPPPCRCGYGKDDPAGVFFGPYDSLEECQEANCPAESLDECIECYLTTGTPYELKIAPPGQYTFSGDVDGEWNNARNWFDEYDLAPTGTSLTLGADVTTLTGDIPVVGPNGNLPSLLIPAGFKLAIEVTCGYVVCQGEIAAVSDCDGKRGQVNGFVYFYGSGHLSGAVLGAAGFRDQSYTESGSVIAGGPGPIDCTDGYAGGMFVFFGDSTNKMGCDSTGVGYLAFATNATNQAVVGDGVEFWENSRNDETGVAGDAAYFNGRNVEPYGDTLSSAISVGLGSMPRTGGNYGIVGDAASFLNDSDNYNIVEGSATFDNADNETDGEVQGNGDFTNEASNKGTVSLDGSFSERATNADGGFVEGDGDFESGAENFGTVKGDATFAEEGEDAFNSGTIEGKADFFNAAVNREDGTIEGDATFDGTSENQGTVDGKADFTVSAQNAGGTVSGDATFKDTSSNNGGIVSGNATFSGSSTMTNNGSVVGDAVFSGSAEGRDGSVGGTAVFKDSSASGHVDNGTLVVAGTATFYDSSRNNGRLEATGAVTFKVGSSNHGTVAGDATFEAGANNYGTVNGFASFGAGSENAGTVKGNATFATGATSSGTVEGSATFAATATNSGTVEGNATFASTAYNSGTVEGNATFSSSAVNAGTVEGDATFASSATSSGTVEGNATFTGASNSGTVSGDATFASSATNSGVVSGNATFSSSANSAGGSVSGNATFSTGSTNSGTVQGYATFSDTSSNSGSVSGGAAFIDTSSNDGSVSGGATFGGFSSNNGTVTGNATFNDASNNNGTVTGTVTCNTTGVC